MSDRCPHCSFQPESSSDYCDKHRPKPAPADNVGQSEGEPRNCDLNCYNYMGAMDDVRHLEEQLKSRFTLEQAMPLCVERIMAHPDFGYIAMKNESEVSGASVFYTFDPALMAILNSKEKNDE